MSGVAPIPQYPDIVMAHSLLGQFGRYHWFLFVADSASKSAEESKIHVIDIPLPDDPSDAWRFENQHVNLNSVPSSICAAAVIGRVPQGKTVSGLVQLLETIPLNEIPPVDAGKEPNFTCRVWIKEAVRRLHAAGFLVCSDVDELEHEMR
ncbi:hypothetical protein NEOLEDRAFT_1072261 [Neolentinus lepideus HHB14362 ss-1]|uniref:Uncharacterized protein n=1 Tax=Neolentinus lepideus HHB14362 ss-1 TaxID=1314782 RepID=A0A165Q9E8_9AGAM|nr:hypothetical protein NEOLEDRAFT_1072261 [Neolentinus lepideus HHB14362 ss-1]